MPITPLWFAFAQARGRWPSDASAWTTERSPPSAAGPAIRYTESPPSIRSRTTAYPRLRSPVSAARVVCGSHPVASVKFGMVAPSDRCSRSMTRASLLPARGARVLACSPMTTGPGALVPSRLGCGFAARFPSCDRLFRSVVDGDGFQPGRGQFERVALASFVSAPDGHSRLSSNLSDQAELDKLFARLW